jgi:Flp pilus assembly protein TadG
MAFRGFAAKLLSIGGLRTSLFCDRGTSLAETALVLPILILLLIVAIDLGRAYYYAIGVSSAAHAAAIYGVQNPTDVQGMVNAASASAPDITSLATSADYGCECSDGSSAVDQCSAPPSCSENYVNYVAITTSATYQTIVSYPGLPNSFSIVGSARLRSGGD